MRRWIFKTWSMALTAAAVGSAAAVHAHAAAQGSAARTATTAPATRVPDEPEAALQAVYVNVPADKILNDIAATFDVVVLKPEGMNARVSVRMPKDADADDAITALKEALIPKGYSLQSGDAVGRIWQVVPATKQDLDTLAAAQRAREAVEATPTTATMKFRFVDTPIETILDQMAQNLGIEIDRATPVPGRISVYVPKPMDAEEALQLLNALLAPSGYTTMQLERFNMDGTPRLAVRVWSIDDAKKGNVPVR